MEFLREEKVNVDEIIEIGQKVTIERTRDKTMGNSNIQDVTKRSVLLLQPSDSKGYPIPLLLGEEVLVSFIGKKGKRYGFSSRVLGHRHTNLFLVEISKPEKIYVVELREFFRTPVFIPFKALKAEKLVLDEHGKNIEYKPIEDAEFEGYIHDLSGGGMFITTEKDLSIGDYIIIVPLIESVKEPKSRIIYKKQTVSIPVISIPKDKEYAFGSLTAKVVRKVNIDTGSDKKGKKYGYGIMFTDIPDEIRERIIAFCIKRQRELKAMGEEP